MDCKSCRQSKTKFRCAPCLKKHLSGQRIQVDVVSKSKTEYVQRTKVALEKMTPARMRRASKAAHERTLRGIEDELKRIGELNDQTRAKLSEIRDKHAHRRHLLDLAQSSLSNLHASSNSNSKSSKQVQPQTTLETLHRSSLDMTAAIARARYGLVRELVEVFDIVEVGGRPSVAGRPGIKGEWNIVGGVLPVPGDIRRYPPLQINATVQHTLHFLNILTYYLGIKLPFEVYWTASTSGVGTGIGAGMGIGSPWISAGKGTESGGWGKWTEEYRLWIEDGITSSSGSASPSGNETTVGNSSPPRGADGSSSKPPKTSKSSKSSSSASRKSSSPPANTQTQLNASTTSLSTSTASLSQSHISPNTNNTPHASFTTGFTMLLYNVAYLAHTQGVDIELSQSGEVLRNLWVVCCSPELGKRSHLTKSQPLPPPTPPTFPIEFNQLLQAITAKPKASLSGHRQTISSSNSGLKQGHGGYGGRKGRGKEETILEEEEWDLV